MTKFHTLRITVASVAGAACLVPSALASWHDPVGAPETAASSISYNLAAPASPVAQGEAKNVLPFTAPVTAAAATDSTVPQGEPKNQAPFTAAYSDPGLALAYAKVAALQAQLAGEPKSGPPFTDKVVSGTGFHWADAAIGAAAMLAVCLIALAGVLAFRRRSESGSFALRVGHV